MKRSIRMTLIGAAAVFSNSAWSAIYIENFETAPGGTGYAAIKASPNGLLYDFYADRAFTRLANIPNLKVVGPGDEAFYWGNNTILPKPLYGLPGTTYSSNTTNYLLNGYGTGYGDYKLGITFTQGPTRLRGLTFGTANGSNAPAPSITLKGLLAGAEVWSETFDLTQQTSLAFSDMLPQVDRIEIFRSDNEIVNPPFNQFPLGWYTVDDLAYDLEGDVSGTYQWQYYSAEEYLAPFSQPVPEPETYALLVGGIAAIVAARRAKSLR